MKKIIWIGLILAGFVLGIITANAPLDKSVIGAAFILIEKNIAILVSFAALIVAIRTSSDDSRFTKIAIRQSQQTDYSNMHFEIAKMRGQDAKLWDICDNPPYPGPIDESQEALRNRLSHVLDHFECYDKVFQYYNHNIPMNKIDMNLWKSWEITIEDFFEKSSFACSTFRNLSKGVYSDEFRDFVNNIIEKTKSKEKNKLTNPLK
jgi:hypothetical protein